MGMEVYPLIFGWKGATVVALLHVSLFSEEPFYIII